MSIKITSKMLINLSVFHVFVLCYVLQAAHAKDYYDLDTKKIEKSKYNKKKKPR